MDHARWSMSQQSPVSPDTGLCFRLAIFINPLLKHLKRDSREKRSTQYDEITPWPLSHATNLF